MGGLSNLPTSMNTEQLISNLKLHIEHALSGGCTMFVFLGASGHGKSTAIYKTKHGGDGLILGLIKDDRFKGCQWSLSATKTDFAQ